MITFLKGILADKTAPKLTLNVNGVGYEAEVSLATLATMPEIGTEVLIYTQLIVREDAQLLYGFAELSEKLMFQTLIKINGVGPKMALAILSSIGINDLVSAICDNNTAMLVKIPGVGKKTAERLIVEMKDKVGSFSSVMAGGVTHKNSDQQEAVAALEALGYKNTEAISRVKAIASEDLSVSELIREALK